MRISVDEITPGIRFEFDGALFDVPTDASESIDDIFGDFMGYPKVMVYPVDEPNTVDFIVFDDDDTVFVVSRD